MGFFQAAFALCKKFYLIFSLPVVLSKTGGVSFKYFVLHTWVLNTKTVLSLLFQLSLQEQ